MIEVTVGIAGLGVYLPAQTLSAQEISTATQGAWPAEAIQEKLGINQIYLPGPEDGTQEMGVRAAKAALADAKVDPLAIDVILSIGEEWKEYPLTTSALYIQDAIGATNAWGIDIAQRCCTTVAAMKIAKDMMMADPAINTVMLVGGYRNGDFVDFTDRALSMMYNLSAGAGAIILQKNLGANLLLGTHIITDGSLSHDVGVMYGGTKHPITAENLPLAAKSLKIFNEQHMKDRLNAVSLENWFCCIDQAFRKSQMEQSRLGYLAVLHFKKSMHQALLAQLHLTSEQTTYLADYGHIGQIDQILSLKLGLAQQKIRSGTVVSMIAAGIGYAWAANVILWGKVSSQ